MIEQPRSNRRYAAPLLRASAWSSPSIPRYANALPFARPDRRDRPGHHSTRPRSLARPPKTYTAHATILFDNSAGATTDAQRELATIQQLLVTRDVLGLTARSCTPRSTSARRCRRRSTRTPTSSRSRPRPDSARCGRTANAVAAAFLARERTVEVARLQAAQKGLTSAIVPARTRGEGADPTAPRTAERARCQRCHRGLRAAPPESVSLRPSRLLRVRCETRHSPS